MIKVSRKATDLLRKSGMLNEEWYLKTYPDVAILEMDPVEHYLWIGARLKRNPSPAFDTAAYLALNGDVERAGTNPLVHYVQWGKSEGRRTNYDEVKIKKEWIGGKISPKMGRPSILLCAHEVHMQLFGGELSFLDVVDALNRLDFNVFIVIPQKVNTEYVNILLSKTRGIFIFKYSVWAKGKENNADVISMFIELINSENIDAVYTNTIFVREAQIAAQQAGVASVCHVRELINFDEHLRNRIGMTAEQIIADVVDRSNLIVANSLETAKLFPSSANVVCAPNVVDPDTFDIPNKLHEKIRFGIISSNTKKKGIEDFIEIARLCDAKIENAEFIIIGPENTFTAELRQKGIPGNTTFAGYAPSPKAAIEQVNIVLSLSHFAESFGRTVAEAQMARRPVIAYNWGAIPELIENEKTGLLIPYRDIEAAVNAVNRFIQNPDLAKSMGESGRKKMKAQCSPVVLQNNLQKALKGLLDVDAHPSIERRITVIIPIYNAAEDVKACIDSIKRWTDFSISRVLLIDDCSTDKEIETILQSIKNNDEFIVIKNKENLGYTRTINKAVRYAEDDDIVLLNSDTIVTPDWLSGLKRVAQEKPDAGTVTAMSDNAGAFSFPVAHQLNPKPQTVSHELWASLIVRAAEKYMPIEVPTGNGFCMFIRREVFEQVGLFDEELFPKGYGEENDFCMRAIAAGWRNFISPYCFIYHERTKSFGDKKPKLVEEGMKVLTRKYPSYQRKVRDAFAGEPIKALRKAVAGVYSDTAKQYCREFDADSVQIDARTINSVGGLNRFEILNDVLINWREVESNIINREKKLVSIVICVFNNIKLTLKCLDSIVKNTNDVDYEIIIVDNGSETETVRALIRFAKKKNNVRLLRNFENLNFSLGNNIGFAATTGAIVVFLNNDTEVTNGWLRSLVAPLSNTEVKGAQPRLLYPNGELQCVGIVFSQKSTLGYPIYSGRTFDDHIGSRTRNYRAITAACMAVRAHDFAAVRGFDPIYINGQEDVDLCLKLGSGSAVFTYVADSVVIHHEGRTPGRGKNVRANRETFIKRWSGRFASDDHEYYAQDGIEAGGYKFDLEEFSLDGIATWTPTILSQTR